MFTQKSKRSATPQQQPLNISAINQQQQLILRQPQLSVHLTGTSVEQQAQKGEWFAFGAYYASVQYGVCLVYNALKQKFVYEFQIEQDSLLFVGELSAKVIAVITSLEIHYCSQDGCLSVETLGMPLNELVMLNQTQFLASGQNNQLFQLSIRDQQSQLVEVDLPQLSGQTKSSLGQRLSGWFSPVNGGAVKCLYAAGNLQLVLTAGTLYQLRFSLRSTSFQVVKSLQLDQNYSHTAACGEFVVLLNESMEYKLLHRDTLTPFLGHSGKLRSVARCLGLQATRDSLIFVMSDQSFVVVNLLQHQHGDQSIVVKLKPGYQFMNGLMQVGNAVSLMVYPLVGQQMILSTQLTQQGQTQQQTFVESWAFYGDIEQSPIFIERPSNIDESLVDQIIQKTLKCQSVHFDDYTDADILPLLNIRSRALSKLCKLSGDEDALHMLKSAQRLFQYHVQLFGQTMGQQESLVERLIAQYMKQPNVPALRTFLRERVGEILKFLVQIKVPVKYGSLDDMKQMYEYGQIFVQVLHHSDQWCARFDVWQALLGVFNQLVRVVATLKDQYVDAEIPQQDVYEDTMVIGGAFSLLRACNAQLEWMSDWLLAQSAHLQGSEVSQLDLLASGDVHVVEQLKSAGMLRFAKQICEQYRQFGQLVKMPLEQQEIDGYLAKHGEQFAGPLYGFYLRRNMIKELFELSDVHLPLLLKFVELSGKSDLLWVLLARAGQYEKLAKMDCRHKVQVAVAKLSSVICGAEHSQHDMQFFMLQVQQAAGLDATIMTPQQLVHVLTETKDEIRLPLALEVAFKSNDQKLQQEVMQRSLELYQKDLNKIPLGTHSELVKLREHPLTKLIVDAMNYGMLLPELDSQYYAELKLLAQEMFG